MNQVLISLSPLACSQTRPLLWGKVSEFVLSVCVCCIFKGASLVCFTGSVTVNRLHTIHVFRYPVIVKSKLELCQWGSESFRGGVGPRSGLKTNTRMSLFDNITVAHASKQPPTTSCETAHQHFHLRRVKTRSNLISITPSRIEHLHYTCFQYVLSFTPNSNWKQASTVTESGNWATCNYYTAVCFHGYFPGCDGFIAATYYFRCHEKKPFRSVEMVPQELYHCSIQGNDDVFIMCVCVILCSSTNISTL